MAADEQEPQHVVAIMRIVQPLGDVGLGIAEIGEHGVLGQRRALATPAHVVERDIASDENEPRGGIARRPIDRPVLQRAQARLLERLLGPVEIAEIAQQRPDRLRPRRSQQRIDPGDVGQAAVSLKFPCGL